MRNSFRSLRSRWFAMSVERQVLTSLGSVIGVGLVTVAVIILTTGGSGDESSDARAAPNTSSYPPVSSEDPEEVVEPSSRESGDDTRAEFLSDMDDIGFPAVIEKSDWLMNTAQTTCENMDDGNTFEEEAPIVAHAFNEEMDSVMLDPGEGGMFVTTAMVHYCQHNLPGEDEDDHTVSDGIHEVGVDIDPGQYKTDGPDGERPCYYKRSSDDSGDSIIDNNSTKGPGSFTTNEGEFLELNGGCTWELQ